jgi:hypothetical protein
MNHAHGRVWIKYEGERLTVSEASRRLNVSPMGLWDRLKRGVSRERLLAPGYGPRPRKIPQHVERARPLSPEQLRSPVVAAMNEELSAEEYLHAERGRP